VPNLPSRSVWRGPLLGLGLLAGLALALAFYHYFTGDDYTLRVQEVTQLKPVPIVVQQVRVGLEALPVRANGYLTTQTHDVSGPFVRVEAAAALLVLLAGCLAYFLAVVSTLPRAAFVAGMALLIFLLMSMNVDLLGLINSREQYFLIITLLTLGLPAFAFHAFWTEVPLGPRLLTFVALVAGLSSFIFLRSPSPADTTALHLVSFATSSGAAVVALLVLWVSFENIQGLLWFNTQAENPASRFGRLPFVLASGLYLGMLFLYYWNNGEVFVLPNVRLEPLVLLVPAVGIGWLSLRRRAATYGAWVPYWPGAAHLYLILTTLAAGFLGYACATANDPLLSAGRDFTALALLMCGAAFLIYVLVNFGPLIKQRLRVYRVVFEPRRVPFYAVYLLGLSGILAVELRNDFFVLDQIKAGYYNNLGDLTRLQSEQQPGTEALALLAERYYAESDALDLHNHRASWGRAALYRFRSQRQNEINALRRAQSRQPSEKISLRLAALFDEPTDFFDRLQLLREGLRTAPRSVRLTSDLAQLYTRSTLTDSVNHYFNRAEALAAGNPVVQANRLAYLLQLQDLPTAQQLVQSVSATGQNEAWLSNVLLLQQLTDAPLAVKPTSITTRPLTAASFALLYHDALRRAVRGDTSQLSTVARLGRNQANDSYAEQLTFLQALTQYYGGQPAAAQTTLLPLTAGNTPSSAYYQNLWGLWLLDLHAYAPAITSLAEASHHGNAEARLNQAYAFALVGQLDSARTATAGLLHGPAADLRKPAGQLERILSLNYDRDFVATSDSVKAQFYALRGREVTGPEYMDGYSWYGTFIKPLQNPAAHDVALLAQAGWSVGFGAPDVAGVLKAYPLRTNSSALAAERNLIYGQALLGCGQLNSKYLNQLGRLLDSAAFRPVDQPRVLQLRAALADYRRQPREAARLYAQLIRQAPFLEDGVLTAAGFSTRQQDYLTAYNFLLTGLAYNPESIALLQAYTLASIPAGLTSYVAEPLEKLRQLLSPTEYHTFHTQYEARRHAQTAASAPWN